MTTLGLIGAGHIGSQVARLAIKGGYDVVLSNSRGPETLASLVAVLGPKARAASVLDELTTHGQPPGTPNRRALVIAGNDTEAKAVVTKMLDQFGFDTVDAGPLSESWRIQRDMPGYGPRRNAEELRKDLAVAQRSKV